MPCALYDKRPTLRFPLSTVLVASHYFAQIVPGSPALWDIYL